jgi:hypothetical protein
MIERRAGAPTAPITALTLVSVDDGQSWQRVPVVRTLTGWLALVPHPASGVRVAAGQRGRRDGSSVDQTIIRAYRLR